MRRAIVFVVLCAACHRASSESEERAPIETRCAEATLGSIDVRVSVHGRIEPPPGADLPIASQVAGRVTQVLVKESDHVDAGATIALIDDLAASRGSARQASAGLEQAKSAAANADATLARTKELVQRGYAAKQELDDAIARADQAHAAVIAAEATQDTAQRTLGRVQVKSAFPGVITHVWRGTGAVVDGTPSTPIVQLASAETSELRADATAGQLLHIAEGNRVTILLSTGGEPLRGTVRARASALDTTGLGTIHIGIDGARPLLGTFATARIDVEHKQDILVVPIASIRGAVLDGASVVVCKDGKAHLTEVKTGVRDEKNVEILEGLARGDKVAIDHVLAFEDDMPIAEPK